MCRVVETPRRAWRFVVWLVVVSVLAPAWIGLGVARAAEVTTGVVLDPILNRTLGGGFNGMVAGVTETADGGFLVAGNFTSLDGDESIPNGLVRFDAEGNLDADFNDALGTGFGGMVRMVTRASGIYEGSFYVAGEFATLDGAPARYIARLDDRGVFDSTFSSITNASGIVDAVHQLADGDILLGGEINSVSGELVSKLARLSPDGEVDSEFTANLGEVEGVVWSIAEDQEGRILIGGGDLYSAGGRAVNPLMRLSARGEVDFEFNSPDSSGFMLGAVMSVKLDKSGRIMAAGGFSNIGTRPVGRLARFSSEGELDTAFNTSLGAGFSGGTIYSMNVTTDGMILVAGSFTSANGKPAGRLARVDVNGGLDTAFNDQLGAGFGGAELRAVRTMSSGIVVGGGFTSLNGDPSVPGRLARLVPGTIEMGTVGDQTATVGESVDLALRAGVAPESAVEFAASGLPAGITLNPATGQITGTPTEAGRYTILATVEVAPVGPSADVTFTWTVNMVPSVSGGPVPGVVGVPYRFDFEVAGSPVPSVTVADEASLPAGLTLSEAGVLSGIPTEAGDAEFTVVASNGVGADASATVSMRVDEAPAVETPWLEHVHPERLPGHVQVVTGGGFVPGEGVSFAMNSARVSLGAAVADDAGRVDWEFVVPDETAPGSHTLTASSESGVVVSATFVVVPHPTQADPGEQDDADEQLVGPGSQLAEPGSQLAWTGSQVGVAALIAATLIILGSVLVGRRRLIR